MYLFATAHSIESIKEIQNNCVNMHSAVSRLCDNPDYCADISTTMITIYNSMSTLADYKHIQHVVEYGLIVLYSCALNTCLYTKNTHFQPDQIKDLYLLRDIRLETVQIPYNMNPLVMERICTHDLEIIKTNDSDPLKLLTLPK